MRSVAIGVLLACVGVSLAAAGDSSPVASASRQVTVLAGFGTSLGGLGAGAEAYFADSRMSAFAGAGYVVPTQDGRGASGLGLAGGMRMYTGGRRHRAYVEASVSPVAVEVAPEGSGLEGQNLSYGPGASLGYQFVGVGGATFAASLGVGYALSSASGVDSGRVQVLSTMGLGYTWHRRQATRP
jgi:hypothetical protein